MIPIPQYPLYTATLAHIGAKAVPYYLKEDAQWSMNMETLKEGVSKAKADGTKLKCLAVINPGNPTGGCLSRDAMKDVVQLCYDEGMVLLADEVYQRNIFDPETRPFISFKEVVRSMPKEIAESVELVSFHSISKGVSGECGRRGGYFELTNINPDVVEQIYKMASVTLCPPVTGQIGVDLLVNPPKPGDASYDQWLVETTTTHDNLASRSKYMCERFNQLDGMSCQPAEGAMYLFPQITMPEKAVAKAKEIGKPADVMYTLDLLGESSLLRPCPRRPMITANAKTTLVSAPSPALASVRSPAPTTCASPPCAPVSRSTLARLRSSTTTLWHSTSNGWPLATGLVRVLACAIRQSSPCNKL